MSSRSTNSDANPAKRSTSAPFEAIPSEDRTAPPEGSPGDAVDKALVDDAAVGVEEVERDGCADPVEIVGYVDRRGR
jgi:hypothetical protein